LIEFFHPVVHADFFLADARSRKKKQQAQHYHYKYELGLHIILLLACLPKTKCLGKQSKTH
jgi:hypothetical protein